MPYAPASLRDCLFLENKFALFYVNYRPFCIAGDYFGLSSGGRFEPDIKAIFSFIFLSWKEEDAYVVFCFDSVRELIYCLEKGLRIGLLIFSVGPFYTVGKLESELIPELLRTDIDAFRSGNFGSTADDWLILEDTLHIFWCLTKISGMKVRPQFWHGVNAYVLKESNATSL